jgi:hypothetical protein
MDDGKKKHPSFAGGYIKNINIFGRRNVDKNIK